MAIATTALPKGLSTGPGSLGFDPPAVTDEQGRFEVRAIGTRLGLRELAALHKRAWGGMPTQEKRILSHLWPLALHFGLYWIEKGHEQERPRLVGAFWARCLADAPLTLGHLYPAQLFKGLLANDVFEFGGMVIDPTFQKRGLAKALADAARLFLISRRPGLIITNPIEPLYPIYQKLGLKTVGSDPVDCPYLPGMRIYLMYARCKEIMTPYYM